jgi:MerR family transcriptional regulator, light-induced transcriptional regulator
MHIDNNGVAVSDISTQTGVVYTMNSVADLHTPRYRSGSVARMLRLPVATLRIWERRYQVAAPATTAAGHRLYSSADVQRLALVKQLVDLGHAISSVASLDMAALQEVASTHASTLATMTRQALSSAPAAEGAAQPAVAVLGDGLWRRVLQLPQASRQPSLWRLQSLPDGLLTAGASLPAATTDCDLLLAHVPALHEDSVLALRTLAQGLGAHRVAVVYGFAAAGVLDGLRQAGVALQRDPLSNAALGRWLQGLLAGRAPAGAAPLDAAVTPPSLQVEPVAPRRYDDAALADFAGLSSTIACECPRHVAELLVQLSHFERYCADCAHRSPEDADLHRYLGQVSGTARALFETALERIAVHEGLMAPA